MISEQPGCSRMSCGRQPVMDHNRMNGFRGVPRPHRGRVHRLGLRPGDQVTAINGTPAR